MPKLGSFATILARFYSDFYESPLLPPSETLHILVGIAVVTIECIRSKSMQLLTLLQVTSTRVATASASNTTVRRRTRELVSHRKRVSGGDEVFQLASEIQLTAKQDRQSLVDKVMKLQGNFKVIDSPEESPAMKTDLQIPWNKLRVMRR